MPAPQIIIPQEAQARAGSGHVNLMVDTLIASASAEDLRAMVRGLIATHSPSLAGAFTEIARSRLSQTNAASWPTSTPVFTRRSSLDGLAVPAPGLQELLIRARSLYGAGMGLASLHLLSIAIRATVGKRWDEEGEMGEILAAIDADVSQAIQSAKEEIEGGRVDDISAARAQLNELFSAAKESLADVTSWGGEFPFERAIASIEYWKL